MLRDCVLPGVLSVFVAALATPLIRRLAHRFGIVDAPDGYRKLHGRTVALGGGVAVLTAAGISTLVTFWAGFPWADALWADPRRLVGIGSGVVLICFIGLLDDRFSLRGRQKLLGQFAAAMLVIAGGVTISQIDLFGFHFELGLLTVPFTLFWLLGCVNSLNLIDGVDGLATTVGIILSITIGTMAALMGHAGEAAMAVILAGSLFGFLLYNWPPAKIFLGDAGSMFIGLSLGVLAIQSSLKGPATVALVAPTAIWAIPIFDVGIAILRRKLTGQSLYATDRGHLHHVLQRRGFGSIGTVLAIAALCLICGVGALASVLLKNELVAAITCSSVLSLLIVTRSFGHAEFHLFWRRLRAFAASFRRLPNGRTATLPMSSRFHGNSELEQAWESLVEFAERFDLCSLNFNVNAPMLGEVFHAQWHRRERDTTRRLWQSELPIVWTDHEIGRLEVSGLVPLGESPFLWAGDLMEALKPFELQVLDILNDKPPAERQPEMPPLVLTAKAH